MKSTLNTTFECFEAAHLRPQTPMTVHLKDQTDRTGGASETHLLASSLQPVIEEHLVHSQMWPRRRRRFECEHISASDDFLGVVK